MADDRSTTSDLSLLSNSQDGRASPTPQPPAKTFGSHGSHGGVGPRPMLPGNSMGVAGRGKRRKKKKRKGRQVRAHVGRISPDLLSTVVVFVLLFQVLCECHGCGRFLGGSCTRRGLRFVDDFKQATNNPNSLTLTLLLLNRPATLLRSPV